MTTAIEFRPRTASLTIAILPPGDLSEIKTALHHVLNNSPADFFTAVGIVADLQYCNSSDEDYLKGLIALFANAGLSLIGLSHHPYQLEILSKYGLADIPAQDVRPVQNNKPAASEQKRLTNQATVHETKSVSAETKIVRGNIRSGQRVYAQGCDLIVIGSIGAGAEIISDGNIHVLGSLRGRAFAGASGDINTHIFATDFTPEIVAIAGNYQNMEQLEPYKGNKNCLVTLNPDETMLIVAV